MTELKPFLEDMLSMSTGTDGRTLQIHFSRPVTKEDRQAFADAHNAIVRGQLTPPPEPTETGDDASRDALKIAANQMLLISIETRSYRASESSRWFRPSVTNVFTPGDASTWSLTVPKYLPAMSSMSLESSAISIAR